VFEKLTMLIDIPENGTGAGETSKLAKAAYLVDQQ